MATVSRCGGRLWTVLALSAALLAVLAFPAAGRAATIQTFPVPTPAAGLSHIVAGPDRALWFTETAAYRVGRITTSGRFTEFPVPNGAVGVTDAGPTSVVASGGALWLLTNIGQTVYRLTTGGALSSPRYESSDDPGITLAPSDTGGVWLMTDAANTLVRLDPSGATTPYQASYANRLDAAALGPDGRVWFNNEGIDLLQLTDTGARTTIPLHSLSPAEISSIAFDSRGHAWFTAYSPPVNAPLHYVAGCCGAIGEVTRGTAKITSIGNQGGSLGIEPHSLTRGPDGDMYFAFYKANPYDPHSFNGIGRVDPATGQIQAVNIAPYVADDIAFGSDHDLWFIDSRDNLIGRVPLGRLFPHASGTGKAPAITLKLPAVQISSLRRAGVASIACKLAGAGRCTVTATIPTEAARKLGLTPRHGANTLTLSHGSAIAKHRANVTVKLKFGKRFLHALARADKNIKLTITGRSSAADHTPVTVRRTLTMRH